MTHEEAEEEWTERFYPLRMKKWAPTLLTSDVIIPTDSLIKMIHYTWELGRITSLDVDLEIVFSSPSEAIFMPLFLTDERRSFKYLTNTAITKKLIDKAVELGGKSYGYGLWNSFHFKKSEPNRRDELIKLKKQLDPNNILNPGKSYTAQSKFGIPLPGIVYSSFLEGLWLIGRV